MIDGGTVSRSHSNTPPSEVSDNKYLLVHAANIPRDFLSATKSPEGVSLVKTSLEMFCGAVGTNFVFED